MNHRKSTRQARHGRGGSSIDAACRVSLLRHHAARGCAHLPRRAVGFLLAGPALLGGCTWSTTTIDSRAPPDPAALSRIRIGETTADEVMRLLGPPHSIIRGSARFREVSAVGYHSYAQDRQLSSLDDEHYALFYKYGKARSHALLIEGITVGRKLRFQGEELLIILDRARDVVTDVVSRSEDYSP